MGTTVLSSSSHCHTRKGIKLSKKGIHLTSHTHIVVKRKIFESVIISEAL